MMRFILLAILWVVPLIGCWIGLIVRLPELFSQYEYERESYLEFFRGTAITTLIFGTITAVIWVATN